MSNSVRAFSSYVFTVFATLGLTRRSIQASSHAIFVCSLSVFGFQKDATVIVVDSKAMNIMIIACLSSGLALLLAAIHNNIIPDIDASAAIEPAFTLPMLLHLSALYYLLVACTSFTAFLLRVAYGTSPRVFTVFAAACSSLPIVFVGFVGFTLFEFLARRPSLISGRGPEDQDIEANEGVAV